MDCKMLGVSIQSLDVQFVYSPGYALLFRDDVLPQLDPPPPTRDYVYALGFNTISGTGDERIVTDITLLESSLGSTLFTGRMVLVYTASGPVPPPGSISSITGMDTCWNQNPLVSHYQY